MEGRAQEGPSNSTRDRPSGEDGPQKFESEVERGAEPIRREIQVLADAVALEAEAIARLREDMDAGFNAHRALLVSLFHELKRDIAELRGRR